MEYMRDDVYSGIGKFIVSYERTQATMKYVIVSNTIVPNFKVGKGRDLGAYKVLKHFRNFMTSNYLSNEITNVNFNIMCDRINSLNKFRNEILHGMVSPSINEKKSRLSFF